MEVVDGSGNNNEDRLSEEIKLHPWNYDFKNNNNNDVIELELGPKLKESEIVTIFAFHKNEKTIELLLNHKYESKTVVFPIDLSSADWNEFSDASGKTLKRKGINKQHITMLLDALDDNWKTISKLVQNSDLDSGSEEEQEEKKTVAQKALALAEEQCSELFLDQFGTEYAAIKIDEHTEILRLKDSRFKNWLCKTFYTSENKILNAESVTNVLNVLKAKAEFDGDMKTLSLRTASIDEEPFTIYYDLTNKDWQVVKITPEGWSIEPSPILFRRYNGQQSQVYPSREYPPDISINS
jgi:hypothetical protein